MPRMPLKTPQNCKNTLAKYIRGYKLAHENDFSDSTARTYGYLFRCLASLLKLELDEELERRVTELEKIVRERYAKRED